MPGSSSSRVRVVVGVMVMTLVMAAAAYTGEDLAQAAKDEHWDKVKEILSATNAGQDLDPNVRIRGATAILWASLRCKADIVQQLVLAQANVNLPTMAGATPVMVAAMDCSTSTQIILRELISAGANLALTDTEGRTALHWAAHWNNPAAVPLLLEEGAPTGVENNDGLTPAQLARQRGNIIIADAIDNFTGITATTTTTPTTTGVTSVEVIDVYLIGSSVCFAVGYILYLLL